MAAGTTSQEREQQGAVPVRVQVRAQLVLSLSNSFPSLLLDTLSCSEGPEVTRVGSVLL